MEAKEMTAIKIGMTGMKNFKPSSYEIRALDLLDESGLIASRSEGRRIITQGGFYLSRLDYKTGKYSEYERITDFNTIINLKGWEVLKVGNRKFARVSPKKSMRVDLNMVFITTENEDDIYIMSVNGDPILIKGAKLCYEIDDDGNIIEQEDARIYREENEE